jgi:hypothetical protein
MINEKLLKPLLMNLLMLDIISNEKFLIQKTTIHDKTELEYLYYDKEKTYENLTLNSLNQLEIILN